MSDWILAAALLFLVGLGLGARADNGANVSSRTSTPATALQPRDRLDPDR